MAAIGPISATPDLQANSIGMQDFLKILLTQLTTQDPLKPMDNQAFMAQMAQFTALEQTQQLNNTIDALLSTQSALLSVGLIGRTVDINSDSGSLSGAVTTLSLAGSSPQLTLRLSSGVIMSNISLAQITAVR